MQASLVPFRIPGKQRIVWIHFIFIRSYTCFQKYFPVDQIFIQNNTVLAFYIFNNGISLALDAGLAVNRI